MAGAACRGGTGGGAGATARRGVVRITDGASGVLGGDSSGFAGDGAGASAACGVLGGSGVLPEGMSASGVNGCTVGCGIDWAIVLSASGFWTLTLYVSSSGSVVVAVVAMIEFSCF